MGLKINKHLIKIIYIYYVFVEMSQHRICYVMDIKSICQRGANVALN